MLVVQKYGGTSVAKLERIANVARRVIDYKKRGDGLVIVVSAMSGETDRLLGLAHGIAKFPDEREVDVLISTGEQVTSALLAITLKEMGYDAVSVLGHQVPIVTDSAFGKARISDIDETRIRTELENGKVVVVPGFQGVDEAGNITTLGRGGSDTTAVAVAAALKADVCEIYTDVDGVYTTDPNITAKGAPARQDILRRDAGDGQPWSQGLADQISRDGQEVQGSSSRQIISRGRQRHTRV